MELSYHIILESCIPGRPAFPSESKCSCHVLSSHSPSDLCDLFTFHLTFFSLSQKLLAPWSPPDDSSHGNPFVSDRLLPSNKVGMVFYFLPKNLHTKSLLFTNFYLFPRWGSKSGSCLRQALCGPSWTQTKRNLPASVVCRVGDAHIPGFPSGSQLFVSPLLSHLHFINKTFQGHSSTEERTKMLPGPFKCPNP